MHAPEARATPGSLDARWRLCSTAPGAPPPGEQAGWGEIAGAMTVAAALRDRGEWTLDAAAQDFDAQDWWYEARFDAPGGGAGRLSFDGLATLCSATLNGRPLLEGTNMFRQHVADAGPLLHDRDNRLVLHFRSLAGELARRRPRPRWRTPMVAHQQLRWHRTTLLGRTPGWSPPAAPVGPWRGIRWLDPWQDSLRWQLAASLDGSAGQVELRWQATPSWLQGCEHAELVVRRAGVEFRCALQGPVAALRVPRPALWWPHTHGEPALYEALVQVQARDGRRHDVPLGRIGFRRVEIDTAAGGFRVRVNDVPVFCRGAGWTPLDPVGLQSTPDACRAALEQVRSAGMNMLRLAGTLVPEEDHFYDACDELGLLVWQDLMFASMDYPFDDAAFAQDAAAEVQQLVQRLHHHACLAVLCGNSEVEQQAAMWGAPRELWQPRFFHETAASLCREGAPGAAYWPSSAHGGAFPHQACTGTTSYYGVGAYERPLEDARRSGLAFATECLAFANVPHGSTLERLTGGLATRVHHPQWKQRSPRDLGAGWDFDDVRDHYVGRLFGVDPARLRHADHDRYLALGRLATAETMAAAFAEWRRPASTCGGALLLFLRDLWAGAGWGVLDDRGVPKSAFHALRRALAPTAAFVTDEGGNGLDVHVVHDGPSELRAVLRVEAWRDGAVRVAQGQQAIAVAAHGARTLSSAELLGGFVDLNHAYRFGPPTCEAVVATLLDAGGGLLAQAFHFPLGLGDLVAQRRALGLQAALRRDGDDVLVQVTSASLAVGVHFDVPGWVADDEHFHLPPGGSRQVRLRRLRDTAPLAGAVVAVNGVDAVPLEADA